MTYIPTKEELEELRNDWLKVIDLDVSWKYPWAFIEAGKVIICYNSGEDLIRWKWIKYIFSIWGDYHDFYPSSLEDLRTLIRLLTPQ